MAETMQTPECGNARETRRAPARRRGAAGLNSGGAGFTLVEISMVLLLFASAVGGLLSFFPVGLRLEANAISDSAQTMFALDVLGQVEANAAAITDWDTWNDTEDFYKAAFKGVKVGGKPLQHDFRKHESFGDGSDRDKSNSSARETIYRTDDDDGVIEHYLTSSGNMHYILQISPVETPIYYGERSRVAANRNYKMRRIAIWVTDRRDGDPYMNTPFTIDLVFRPALQM